MKPACLLAIALLAALPLAAEKKIIQPKEFAPGGPFNPAVLVDGTLYVSGQIGRDLKTQKIPDDFDAEVKQVLENIGVILREAKMNYGDVVAVQVYLTDMDQFQKMNAIYTSYFKDNRPSRTTVGVAKLAAPNAHIEVTVTARREGSGPAPCGRGSENELLGAVQVLVNGVDVRGEPVFQRRPRPHVDAVLLHSVGREGAVAIGLKALQRRRRDGLLQLVQRFTRFLASLHQRGELLDIIPHLIRAIVLVLHRAVAGQKMIRLKLANRINRSRPLPRIAVGDVRKKADDRVPGSDNALLRTE